MYAICLVCESAFGVEGELDLLVQIECPKCHRGILMFDAEDENDITHYADAAGSGIFDASPPEQLDGSASAILHSVHSEQETEQDRWLAQAEDISHSQSSNASLSVASANALSTPSTEVQTLESNPLDANPLSSDTLSLYGTEPEDLTRTLPEFITPYAEPLEASDETVPQMDVKEVVNKVISSEALAEVKVSRGPDTEVEMMAYGTGTATDLPALSTSLLDTPDSASLELELNAQIEHALNPSNGSAPESKKTQVPAAFQTTPNLPFPLDGTTEPVAPETLVPEEEFVSSLVASDTDATKEHNSFDAHFALAASNEDLKAAPTPPVDSKHPEDQVQDEEDAPLSLLSASTTSEEPEAHTLSTEPFASETVNPFDTFASDTQKQQDVALPEEETLEEESHPALQAAIQNAQAEVDALIAQATQATHFDLTPQEALPEGELLSEGVPANEEEAFIPNEKESIQETTQDPVDEAIEVSVTPTMLDHMEDSDFFLQHTLDPETQFDIAEAEANTLHAQENDAIQEAPIEASSVVEESEEAGQTVASKDLTAVDEHLKDPDGSDAFDEDEDQPSRATRPLQPVQTVPLRTFIPGHPTLQSSPSGEFTEARRLSPPKEGEPKQPKPPGLTPSRMFLLAPPVSEPAPAQDEPILPITKEKQSTENLQHTLSFGVDIVDVSKLPQVEETQRPVQKVQVVVEEATPKGIPVTDESSEPVFEPEPKPEPLVEPVALQTAEPKQKAQAAPSDALPMDLGRLESASSDDTPVAVESTPLIAAEPAPLASAPIVSEPEDMDFDMMSKDFFESPARESGEHDDDLQLLLNRQKQKSEGQSRRILLTVVPLLIVLVVFIIIGLTKSDKQTGTSKKSSTIAAKKKQNKRPLPPNRAAVRKVPPPPLMLNKPDAGTQPDVGTQPDAAPVDVPSVGAQRPAPVRPRVVVIPSRPVAPRVRIRKRPVKRRRIVAKRRRRPVRRRRTRKPRRRYSRSAAKRYFKRGQSYLMQGKISSAIRQLRRANRADPRYSAPYRVLGAAYMRQGKKSSAKRAWRTFLRLNPKSPMAGFIRKALKN